MKDEDRYNKRTYGRGGLRMEDMGRMVHAFLEGAVKMRECFCTTCEAKFFAQVVAAFEAIFTILAHNACLDSHSITDR